MTDIIVAKTLDKERLVASKVGAKQVVQQEEAITLTQKGRVAIFINEFGKKQFYKNNLNI